MWLKVNGVLRQNSSTANMIFDAATLVSYVSQFMTLLPGDVISTGTPAGVALGMKTPEYLKPGDIVELGVEGLGESRQQVDRVFRTALRECSLASRHATSTLTSISGAITQTSTAGSMTRCPAAP